RDPYLADRRVRRDDELRFARLFEQQVEDAVLQLELETGLVGQRQQRSVGLVERLVAADAKLLLCEGSHRPVKPLPPPARLTEGKAGDRSCTNGHFPRRRSGWSACCSPSWSSR